MRSGTYERREAYLQGFGSCPIGDRAEAMLALAGEQVTKDVFATWHYGAAGPRDLVILATTAHQVDAVVRDVLLLFGRARR